MLVSAAFLAFFIGLAHSVLGEKYILIRLFRRGDLPRLFGDDWFTRRTLRFTWHLTTLAWWGFGLILIVLSDSAMPSSQLILGVISAIFFISALISAGFTRARHLSWIVFLLISLLCAYVALGA